MGNYKEEKEDFEDKYFPKNDNYNFYDEYENYLFPGAFGFSTEEDLKNKESIKNDDNKIINFTISNESIIIPKKENNYEQNYKNPKKSNILLEKENILNLNLKNNILNEPHEPNEPKISYLQKKTKKNTKAKYNKYNKPIKIINKCKHLLLNAIFDFINNKIKELYNNDIGKGVFEKQLKTLNKKEKSESNVNFNKELLNRTIKDIFSESISGKYTFYPQDYNKKIIESLLGEKDLIKKDFFNNLFNLTFLQCLEHYRGSKFYNELNGMRLYEEDFNNVKDNELYESLKVLFLNDFENKINKRRSRKPRRKKKILKT